MAHAERCPICEGTGLVMNGFYDQTSGFWSTTDCSSETCRSCNGKGYVEVQSNEEIFNNILRLR
jgi:predicted methyltransferase